MATVYDLPNIAVLFAVAFLVLGIGMVILSEVRTNIGESQFYTTTLQNTTTALTVGNNTLITHPNLKSFGISYLNNASQVSTNWNVTGNGLDGTLYVAPENTAYLDWYSAGGDANYNLTYTYTIYGDAWNATTGGMKAGRALTDWSSIMGICVAASIVLGLIFFALGRKNEAI